MRFAPPGRQPTFLTDVRESETAHILPQWLPGSRTFTYTARRRAMAWGGDDVYAHTLGTNERKKLLTDAVDARYAGGYIVFLRRGLLMAVPFDAATLECEASPLPCSPGSSRP